MAHLLDKTRLHLGNPQLFQRLVALLCLLGIVVVFRHIAVLFVSFLLFSKVFGFLGKQCARLFRGNHRAGVLFALVLVSAILVASIWIAWEVRLHVWVQSLPEELKALKDTKAILQKFISKLPSWLQTWVQKDEVSTFFSEKIKNYFQENGGKFTGFVWARLSWVGNLLLQNIVGLVLAIVYQLNPEPIHNFWAIPPQNSVIGVFKQYLVYCAEAIVITVQLQVLVALVNTVLTLPVLFLLRLPHKGLLSLVIFSSSLIPILGNFFSGAILMVCSYLYRGVIGAVVFLVITFLLHKLETYYLNPRLASRHVRLPILILACSLILFEHVFGWVGVFLSFPCLYVGIKIYQDWQPYVAQSSSVNA